ncbi:teichoic acid transporter [Thalassotalea insulae]|uniref:Teichoic acid transporter n=1 Tax=Thalassotalea insulae TaxID=2056778 RepID=A0ABQ6GQF2_9GAMM|nr:oligosaccharide flippase family protein [Thalassotalea insulae]GLX78195.1 teichoic acid transporter [Thalassotalea insulae]
MIKQLFASSFFRLLENIIMVAISLLLTPFFIKTLGTNDYGLWLLTLSILGWFNVIDLGFPAAVQRQVTIALEKKNDTHINTIFSTSIMLFGTLGAISSLGLFAVAQFPEILDVNNANQITFSAITTVLIIKVLWDFFMNAFHGFFSGMLRYDIDANISSFNSIVKAVLVFILIPEMHIWGAVAATLVADFLSNILKIVYVKKLYPPLVFRLSLISVSELKELFHFSKHVIASGVASSINTKSAPILVTKLFELTLVPIYSIANRLSTLVEGFAKSISAIFQPVFTRMVARKENMEVMFHEVSLINITVYSILYQTLFVFGGVFIILWVGKEFEDSVWLMNILVFTFLCRALSWSTKAVLLAQANHKLLALTNLSGAICNIISSIVLSHYFGLIGIALGSAIGFFMTDVVFNLLLLKRYNNFNLTPVLKGFLLSIVLTYSVGIIGQYLLANYMAHNWLMLITSGIVLCPFIVLINWLVLLNKDIKQKTITTIAAKLPFLKAT